MDREHEVGDLVEVMWTTASASKKTLAVVMKKERILSKIEYDIYYPSSTEMSYGWEDWELERVVR